MKLKNKTKSILIKKNKYKNYKNLFATKQTRFLLTKIIAKLNPKANPEECAMLEMQLTENKNDMFIEGAKQIPNIAKNKVYAKADWEALGKFLYYVFQTGVFYKNKKTKTNNIFCSTNYNQLNTEKKMLFNDFIESIKFLDSKHNVLVKDILEVVL